MNYNELQSISYILTHMRQRMWKSGLGDDAMYATELMTGEVSIIDLGTSVADAAAMMRARNTGCVVVVDMVKGGAVAGIITERDMVLGCLIDGHTSLKCPVYRHMTALSEAATPETDAGDALLIMMDGEVDYLPVVSESGGVVGLLYAEDISRAIEEEYDPIAVLDGELMTV